MTENIDYVATGSRIRSARLKKELTHEKLANEADITPTYVSAIENGTSKVALPTLVRIAAVLDTTVDTLLYDSTPVLVSQYDAEAKAILEDCSSDERAFLLDLMQHAKEDLRKNIKIRR